MKTTEPTTPQPKPADAAGLLPCPFCEGREAIIHHDQVNDVHFVQCRCGASGPIVTASEIAAPAWNAKRPLPTPHAAEAGVWAGDGDEMPSHCPNCGGEIVEGAQIYVCDWCEKECCTPCSDNVGDKLACEECIAAGRIKLPLPARHRPAAETVGTGDPWRDAAWQIQERIRELNEGRGNYIIPGLDTLVDIISRFFRATPPATQSASGAIAAVLDMAARGRASGTLDVQKAQAELAATQSALEQARVALEDSETDLQCYEGDPKFPAKNATLAHVRTTLAALSAVLPPAKGGAQG